MVLPPPPAATTAPAASPGCMSARRRPPRGSRGRRIPARSQATRPRPSPGTRNGHGLLTRSVRVGGPSDHHCSSGGGKAATAPPRPATAAAIVAGPSWVLPPSRHAKRPRVPRQRGLREIRLRRRHPRPSSLLTGRRDRQAEATTTRPRERVVACGCRSRWPVTR